MACAVLLLLLVASAAGANPNLKYFGVWSAEAGCPQPAEPQPHPTGYYHYPNTGITCPGCKIKTIAVGSVAECQTACNATEKCVATELEHSPSATVNCTLLTAGGPGASNPSRDTYVRTAACGCNTTEPRRSAMAPLPAASVAAHAPAAAPNLTCEVSQKEWINFLFTSSDPIVIKRYHAAGLGPSLLHVRETFFCGNRLCADYKAKWAALLASTVKPMLKEGSLFGVFFGDEICNFMHATSELYRVNCALSCCCRACL